MKSPSKLIKLKELSDLDTMNSDFISSGDEREKIQYVYIYIVLIINHNTHIEIV